jgi:transposase-like protein
MVTPAILACPHCALQHIDKGKWATFDHKRHLCSGCGRFFEASAPNVGVTSLKTP